MRKAKWLLAVSLIITLLGAFIGSGAQTVGGKVSVKSIRIASEDGKTISALLFVPDTATNKTPAPAVLAVHGYVNVKEHMTEYAIELARRGYVVLAPDLSGHGYSERSAVDGALKQEKTATGGVNDAFKALYNMPFIDQKNVSIIGHSLGALSSQVTQMMNADKVKALGLLGYCPMFPVAGKCNVAVLLSQYDESGHFFLNDAKTIPEGKDSQNMKAAFNTNDPVVTGKLYGSFEDGTARQWFMPQNTHPGDLFRKQPIADIVGFLQNSSPAPNPIDPNNQIWKWHQFGTLIALLGFAFSIFAAASLMLKTKYFGTLVQTVPKSSGLKGIYRWIAAAVITAIPAFTLIKFGNAGSTIAPSKLLPMEWSNITFTWAAGTAVIFLVLFAIWHFVTAKSAGDRNAVTYGLSTSTENPEFKWKYIGKSLLLAIITLGIPYTLLCLVYNTLNLDYRFIVVMFHPMDFVHFKIFLVYLIPSLIFFFAASLVTNNWFRTKEFTGAKAIIPYAANALIAVAGLIVFDLIQYITMFQTGAVKWGGGIDLMLGIVEWQLIPLIAFASMIATYFYKKTANIYTGVFTSAVLVAWYSVCINAINVLL